MHEFNTPIPKRPLGYSKYLVYPDGKIFSDRSNSFLMGSKNSAGYINVRLTSDSGVTLTWGLHRLLAFVFLCRDIPSFVNMVINHKDGNKENNSLQNFELVSQKKNIEHAGELQLTSRCLPVMVRNVVSGVITEYPSVSECARAFCLTKDTILYRLRQTKNKVFPGNLQFKLKHSGTGWDNDFNLSDELKTFGSMRRLLVRQFPSLEILCFNSGKEAAAFLGVSEAFVSQTSNNPLQPVVMGLVQIKPDISSVQWRNPEDYLKDYEAHTGQRCVVVWNSLTDESKIFLSLKECAKENGLGVTALHYRLNSKEKVYHDGRSYRYYFQSPVR